MKWEFSSWYNLIRFSECTVFSEQQFTCCHLFEQLKKFVMSLIDKLGALYDQFPEWEVTVQYSTYQPTLVMLLDVLLLDESSK